ncbi:MAG TPA: alcohol dehydrogenase catalytic domain-containing protein [Candidatus Faecousia faecavium]|nr:alcohol dehydrogenase catalytic domain-containing protein [Candidatus Faecousia faecavium]
MKAAVFEREGVLAVKDIAKPQITKPDQILIEVEACSICGTDVHITAVPPGYIATPGTTLGHEFCGHVVETGSAVTNLKIGDRVVVNPNNYCGTCTYCRKNLPNLCEHIEALGIDYDGAFAKYCCVSAKVAYPISEDVPAEIAACAEPLACAINGLNKVHVVPGSTAVVVGSGPIGLMITMLLKSAGVGQVFLLEAAPWRIEFAKKLNIATVIDPIHEDAMSAILEATQIGADYVFDVTGSQIKSCVDYVRKGGQVVLFGVNKKARIDIAQSEITTKEILVSGTWLANATFPDAVRVLERKCIDVASLITDVIALDDISDGTEKLRKGQAVKVIVKP